ncbi:MAG: hypothetical protein ACRCUM_01745 [Mycoplasmoidaceae bacterium]
MRNKKIKLSLLGTLLATTIIGTALPIVSCSNNSSNDSDDSNDSGSSSNSVILLDAVKNWEDNKASQMLWDFIVQRTQLIGSELEKEVDSWKQDMRLPFYLEKSIIDSIAFYGYERKLYLGEIVIESIVLASEARWLKKEDVYGNLYYQVYIPNIRLNFKNGFYSLYSDSWTIASADYHHTPVDK